jgi:hypothetical protein
MKTLILAGAVIAGIIIGANYGSQPNPSPF